MSKALHFTVTGEFMTETCRSLWWDEGRCALAIKTLECCDGITEAQVMDVIFGRAKLVGDSEEGITFEQDDAKKSPCGNKIKSLVHYLADREKKDKQNDDEMYDLVHEPEYMASPCGLIAVGKRKAKKIKDGKMTWEEAHPELCRQVYTEGAVQRNQVTDSVTEPQQKLEPLDPDPSMSSTNGWIDRDGNFFPCGYTGHAETAYQLGHNERKLEKLGWIKISRSAIDKESMIHCGSALDDSPARPTEQQKNTVSAWCAKYHQKLPYWMEEEKL